MHRDLIKRALVAAIFIGPLGACAEGGQNIPSATNQADYCAGYSVSQLHAKVSKRQAATIQQSQQNSPVLGAVLCKILPA